MISLYRSARVGFTTFGSLASNLRISRPALSTSSLPAITIGLNQAFLDSIDKVATLEPEHVERIKTFMTETKEPITLDKLQIACELPPLPTMELAINLSLQYAEHSQNPELVDVARRNTRFWREYRAGIEAKKAADAEGADAEA
eukprot:TRINITY_DN24714_c0_g1_i1.p1 TRINITY_DN24714_c0_g1~~TRINITY_DN24714_c0_g1_i1.p1  ORF type:complete len:144 (-),score=15.56 TRINITY_DN24714_c0_g1_i1:338-769(-)